MKKKYKKITKSMTTFRKEASRLCRGSKCGACIFRNKENNGCNCLEVLKIINVAYNEIINDYVETL